MQQKNINPAIDTFEKSMGSGDVDEETTVSFQCGDFYGARGDGCAEIGIEYCIFIIFAEKHLM